MNFIHQIWIQGAEHFKQTHPEQYQFSLNWRQLYPDFEYKFWGEEEYLPLIEQYSPALLHAYKLAPSFSAKSDIARWVILYMNPGTNLYADTDYECFKRCDYLFEDEKINLLIVAMNLSKSKLLFGNYKYGTCFIVAKSGSVHAKRMLDRIASNPFDKLKQSAFDYAWTVTGPKGLTDLVQQFKLDQEPDVRILPHSMIEVADFSNLSVTTKTKDQILDLYPFAVGVHRMDGSWIANAKHLKASVGQLYSWLTSWSDFVQIALIVIPILILFVVLIAWKVVHAKRAKNAHMQKQQKA